MLLYVVRHAIALPHGTPGVKEDDRTLSEEGASKMKEIAKGLRAIGYIPQVMLSSPLIRAAQTAEILQEVLGSEIKLQITEALAPSGSRQELYRIMDSYRKVDGLMIVGHQPSLGEIAGEIVWGSPEHFVELKKGGACLIELENTGRTPRGRLISLLTPSILRKVAA